MVFGYDFEEERKYYIVLFSLRKITLKPLGFTLVQAVLLTASKLLLEGPQWDGRKDFGAGNWFRGSEHPRHEYGVLLGVMKPSLPHVSNRT